MSPEQLPENERLAFYAWGPEEILKVDWTILPSTLVYKSQDIKRYGQWSEIATDIVGYQVTPGQVKTWIKSHPFYA
jgi:hypothetical protein